MALGSIINAQSRGSVLDSIAHPNVLDPAKALIGAAQGADAIWRVRGAQASQAAGEAYQNAIDPQTGAFDANRFRANLAAAGPTAAMAAGTSLANVQNISSNQLEQQKLKLGIYYGATGALPDNASYNQVINTIDHLGASGVFNSTDLANEKAGVPKDPAALTAYIQQHRLAAASAMDQYHAQYGSRQAVTTEEGTFFPTVPPAAQPGTPSLPRGLDPKWLLEPGPAVPERDSTGKPTGKMIPMTNGEWLEMNGRLPPGTMDKLKASGYSGGNGSIGTGRPPSALTNHNKPPATPIPAPPVPPETPPAPAPGAPASDLPPVASNAPASPGGVRVAGGGPGFAPAVGAPGAPSPAVAGDVNAIITGINNARAAAGGAPAAPATTSAAAITAPPAGRASQTLSPDERFRLDKAGPNFQAEMDKSDTAVQQSALLGNMLADSASFVPGKDATSVQAFQSRLQYWAPGLAKAFGIEPSSLANKESFDKIAAQIANAQGAQSDKRLEVIEAATPHSEMTPAGIDKIIRQLQGNADYLQYRAKLAANYPRQYDYQGFQKDVQQLDPRVFQLARMTKPQRDEYRSQLDPETDKEIGRAILYKTQLDKQMGGGP